MGIGSRRYLESSARRNSAHAMWHRTSAQREARLLGRGAFRWPGGRYLLEQRCQVLQSAVNRTDDVPPRHQRETDRCHPSRQSDPTSHFRLKTGKGRLRGKRTSGSQPRPRAPGPPEAGRYGHLSERFDGVRGHHISRLRHADFSRSTMWKDYPNLPESPTFTLIPAPIVRSWRIWQS